MVRDGHSASRQLLRQPTAPPPGAGHCGRSEERLSRHASKGRARAEAARRGRRTERDDAGMTVVKINAITVGPDSGDELARRFAARAGAVDGQDGFEGFELLRPTDDRLTWLVVTRWSDEESFQAWVSSRDFGAAHGQRDQGAQGERPGGTQPPVGMSAELWGYEVVDL